MELSVVITHYKTPELLKICLKSVKEGCEGIKSEIIVVDSDSNEETREMVEEDFSEVLFIPLKKNVGYTKLVNMGICKARGRFILLMNADIIAVGGSIGKMLSFIKQNIDVGIVGPQLLNFNDTVQYSCFRFYTPLTIVFRRTFLGKLKSSKKLLNRFVMREWDHSNTRDVDWLMGSALMISSRALRKVGLMDERFFMYFEDVDLCRRFWEAGFRVVYFPRAKMYHYHGKVSDKGLGIFDIIFNRNTRVHIVSAVKYFLKYGIKNTNNNEIFQQAKNKS